MPKFPSHFSSFRALCLLSSLAALLGAGCASNLNKAATSDHPEKVDRFLASGANVNQVDKDGATPLINAAQSGNLAIIEKLVDCGANVNAADHDGYTALMYLASDDTYRDDAVSYLLQHGARTDLWSAKGETVLILAAKRECGPAQAQDQLRLLTLLIKAGASLGDDTREGEHPLQLAALAGQPDDSLDLLLHSTPAQAQTDRKGMNALSAAARGDRRSAEEFFIRRGLKPQQIDPAPPARFQWPPQVDPSFPVTARACDAYGDFLNAQGASGSALENYERSASAYASAVAQCQIAVDRYSDALKKQKQARKNRIISNIFIDTVGVGVGAATGVGFFLVPKRVPNDIDEFEDKLDELQPELTSLKAEQALLTAKISRAKAMPPTPPASGT